MILATIAGLFYGRTWMKTGSLFPGAIVHALVDISVARVVSLILRTVNATPTRDASEQARHLTTPCSGLEAVA